MPITPEHALQTMINKWVRNCVPTPHFFTGIDRAKRSGQFTHVREKARGLVSGTPDTILLVPGLPLIAVELKAPGNKPTDQQRLVGSAITEAGGIWDWTDSVTGYCAILTSVGVPLAPRAQLAAAAHDATLAAAAIRREEGRTGKVSTRRYAAKPTVAQVRTAEALRVRVRF